MTAADQAIAECRRLLDAPPRAAQWWDGLSRGEQRMLVAGAEISSVCLGAPWEELDDTYRIAIVATARRASAWATRLLEDLP